MTATATPRVSPPWTVVAGQELQDLWRSAKGMSVLFGYTVLLALLSYLASSEASVNLLDARESVGIVVQVAIALGALAALVVSADAISGERERGTLEAILVTPVSRRSLVIGKLAAATTMWVAALVVALPYVIVMARGPGIAVDAVLVLLIAGSLVAASLTALGLAISSIALSNRMSLAAALSVMLLLAAPSQLPAVKANGAMGTLLLRVNPVSAGLRLAKRVLVDNLPWSSEWTYIISPLVATVVLTMLAIFMSRRLELGGSR